MIAIPLLRQLLTYDEFTGKLFWRERPPSMFKNGRCWQWNAKYADKEAFINLSKRGYLKGLLFGHTYAAHRVAFALHFGFWPPDDVDHINGITSDNRAVNLRAATRQQNSFNRRKRMGASSSAYLGVCRTQNGTWLAQAADLSGKLKYLGAYPTPEDAAKAYDAAVIAWRGEFARPNFEQVT